MVLISNGSPSYEVQAWTIRSDIGDVEYIDEDDDYVYYTVDGQDYKFPAEYSVKYLKDDKMIISIESYDSETEMYSYEYEIMDLDENVVYESDCIRTYDDYYLVKNENGMMVLLDKDLNEVTDEYDRIYYSADMDSAYEFSSYGDVN